MKSRFYALIAIAVSSLLVESSAFSGTCGSKGCSSANLLKNVSSAQEFSSSIPVLDLRDFQNEVSRPEFLKKLSDALHEYGFFGLTHTEITPEMLRPSYDGLKTFFEQSTREQKMSLHDPALGSQRGFTLSEKAQNASHIDHKEFLHIGHDNNIWPSWLASSVLQAPLEGLLNPLDQVSQSIQEALSLSMGSNADFLKSLTEGGSTLMRTIYYPANPAPGQFWAAEHTDIDLFTILPYATEEGLQILHNGQWVFVNVPPGAVIVNAGDMLEYLTNGYYKSSVHRVLSKPNLTRYSIVYFIHPRANVNLGPLPYWIKQTGGVVLYPEATQMDLLARRLCELGIAVPFFIEHDAKSGLIDRIKAMENRAPSVQKTLDIYLKNAQKNVADLNKI